MCFVHSFPRFVRISSIIFGLYRDDSAEAGIGMGWGGGIPLVENKIKFKCLSSCIERLQKCCKHKGTEVEQLTEILKCKNDNN